MAFSGIMATAGHELPYPCVSQVKSGVGGERNVTMCSHAHNTLGQRNR